MHRLSGLAGFLQRPRPQLDLRTNQFISTLAQCYRQRCYLLTWQGCLLSVSSDDWLILGCTTGVKLIQPQRIQPDFGSLDSFFSSLTVQLLIKQAYVMKQTDKVKL